MADRLLTDLLARLDSAVAADRLDAATRLRDLEPPPVDAVPALVAHLADDGHVDEEWTDWNGSVVGGTTHHVADRVGEALVRLGTPAFTAVLAAVEAGAPAPVLDRLAAGVPMDALLAAGPDAVARARRCTREGRGELALAWAEDELSRADDRLAVLGRRLSCSVGPTAQLAARELGTAGRADAPRAATLLAEALLGEPPASHAVQCAAGASLDRLGPVLDPPLAARLVAIAPTRAMFYCWPELLPAVAGYGEAARSLGPWLLAWVRDDRSPLQIGTQHHANVRTAAATAIARLGDAAAPLHDELAEIYAAGPSHRQELVRRAVPDRSVLVTRLGARWRTVLAGSDRRAIEDALGAIEELGAAAAPLVDAIAPFVEGDQASWRATLAVGELGEAARPVVPALIRALDDARLRSWACISLGKLGPAVAGDAIAPLEALAARERAAGDRSSNAGPALDRLRRKPGTT